MRSIDGWGVWFRRYGDGEKTTTVPPTRRFAPTSPSRGEAL